MACQILQGLRGRLALHTSSAQSLSAILHGPGVKSAYAGFDPTASSLHVGNLSVMVTMARLQSEGFKPIWLIGDLTGSIGDPSGKSTERPLLDKSLLQTNMLGLKRDLQAFIKNSETAIQASGKELPDDTRGEIADNSAHYAGMGIMDFFVTIGRHMRISGMLARDSVANRLREDAEGMSLTEFAYQAFQAYDFVWLNKNRNAVLQVGGSDQWGNICAGIELVHKINNTAAHGLTVPLLTTQSGEKFGKSAGNAVWLDSSKTSHFDFYQFLFNQPDDMLRTLLGRLTLLPTEKIDSILEQHEAAPHLRQGQSVLASEVLRLVRGSQAVEQAAATSSVVFSKVGVHELGLKTLQLAASNDTGGVQSYKLARGNLDNSLDRIAAAAGLCASVSEARRQIKAGGLYINGTRVSAASSKVEEQDLVDGAAFVLRAGKKKHVVVFVE